MTPDRRFLPDALRSQLRDRAQTGGRVMASAVRKSKMKAVPLAEVKDDLSRFLREAETQDVVITRHGRPAGVRGPRRQARGRKVTACAGGCGG